MVDQNPIGKSSRSNPITYIKAYDSIRDLYAKQNLAKTRGFQPGPTTEKEGRPLPCRERVNRQPPRARSREEGGGSD